MISMQNIVEICERVFKVVEENNLDIRFFEIVTMIGFIEFQRQKCDYVLLECGLGGKLDATNVVIPPDVICSVIVSIGMDHMDVIGDTLEDIAEEKSGIFKTGVPVVLGPTCQGLKEIEKRIADTSCEITWVPKQDTHVKDNNFVVQNIIQIITMNETSPNLINLIAKVSQPCRFEKIINRPENIILDVCHNIDGFRAVLDAIRIEYPTVNNIKLVFGISKSKKLDQICELLENDKYVKDIFVVSRTHMRLYKAEDAYKCISKCGSSKLRDLIIDQQGPDTAITRSDDTQSDGTISQGETFVQNITKTLDTILENNQINNPECLLLICGSFFIMSDVKQYFGYDLEVDTI